MWTMPTQMFTSFLTTYFYLLQLLVSYSSGEIYQFSTKYLNSESDCKSGKILYVNETTVYKVKIHGGQEKSKSTFMECQMRFEAKPAEDGSVGHVCLVQETHLITIGARNVRFSVLDLDDEHGKEVIPRDNKEHHWDHQHFREYCSETNGVTISLSLHPDLRFQSTKAKEQALQAVDMAKLTINLNIWHVGSRKRRVDMESFDCERFVYLYKSSVSVYNRRRPEDLKETPFSLRRRCQITFLRDTAVDRSICLVYIPHGIPDCSSNWTLSVIKKKDNIDDDNVLYEMICEWDPRATMPHAWCAPNSLYEVTLVHERIATVKSHQTEVERPELYRVVVTDFPGGDADIALNFTQKWLAEEAKWIKSEASRQATDGSVREEASASMLLFLSSLMAVSEKRRLRLCCCFFHH